MKTMKSSNLFKTAALIVFSLTVLSSCNKDDIEKAGTGFLFKATYPGTSSETTKSDSKVENGELSNGVIVENFRINIGEIELEFDDDDPMFQTDSFASDIEMEGPFEIDLMAEGVTLEIMLVDFVELPAAAYKEIEFEFEKSENSISEMFMKSVLVKGTIDGIPFVFWSDEDFDMEIEFEDKVYLDEAKHAVITVSFDIVSLFDPANGGIDISNAVDGNGNGIIEIYPDDPDGNEELAGYLQDRLEDIIDAFEEKYDN